MSAEPWIDNLARTLATGQSRRAALKQLVGGIAGALLASTLPGRAASAAKCQPKGGSCSSDSDCCSGLTCQSGECRPSKCQQKGGSCASDSDCCSGLVCSSGVCTAPTTPKCQPKGGPCASDSDCCSGQICRGGVCGPAKCHKKVGSFASDSH